MKTCDFCAAETSSLNTTLTASGWKLLCNACFFREIEQHRSGTKNVSYGVYIALIASLLCSCSTFDYTASIDPAGVKSEHVAYNTFGGSSVMDTAGGTRLTQNHNKTGGQFFQTVATGLAAWGRSAVVSSDNNAATAAGNQATIQSVAKTKSDTTIKLAEIAAEAEKVKVLNPKK